MRVDPVRDTAELRRVLEMPRRLPTLEEAESLVDEWTDMLVTKAGRAAGARLKPWQAYVCREVWQQYEAGRYGTFFLGPVGVGKTLLGMLIFYILSAKRGVLTVPASLRAKTYKEMGQYSRHWATPSPPPRIVTYRELTEETNVYLLDALRPDVLIPDECDCLRNHGASMVKRMARHVDEAWDDHDAGRGDGVVVVPMSGTPGRLSILDYSHLLAWSLRDRAPVPVGPSGPKETATWAAAIDEKPSRFGPRPGVGALELFPAPPVGSDGTRVDRARAAFRDRLCQTPGVVIVDEESCDQPLTIEQVLAPEDPILDPHFEVFRTQWVTPDDPPWPLSDPLSVYRFDGELGTGMYLQFVDADGNRPPLEWLTPRKAFCTFVRERIEASARSSRPLDTEAAVVRVYRDEDVVQNWLAVKPTFKPVSRPVWLSSSLVQTVATWALAEPGLVWCKNAAFAEALAAATGLEYYASGGENAAGKKVEDAPPDRSAILSIDANLRGRNLQHFCRNGVVNWPQSARFAEQLMGRTHRSGQLRPVYVTAWMTSGLTFSAFEACRREALFVKRTTGVTQKLLRATVRTVVQPMTSQRWA